MSDKRIDILASRWHYLDHLAPVWRALPEDIRGGVLVESPRLLAHPVAAEAKRRQTVKADRISRVLVASGTDMLTARRQHWGIALMEHGAGQTYSSGKPSSSYAGGPARQGVGLFLCTNQAVAQANALYGPRTVVVGCPRLRDLEAVRAEHRASERPTLALTWHWACRIAPPWSGWAWPEFVNALVALRLAWPGPVIGHAHPRAWKAVETAYRQASIEPVQRWEDVIARADVLSFDNTSAGFEAAALGIPVVLCESSAWKRDTEHGLRFWRWADIGPTVRADTYPEAIARNWVDASLSVLHPSGPWKDQREAMAAETYPHREDSTERAVSALLRWVGSPRDDSRVSLRSRPPD